MSREQLLQMARNNIAHGDAGTIPQAKEILKVPACNYYDEGRWKLEMKNIFNRMPLMLAMSAEIRKPGDYKAMEASAIPIIIVRDKNGHVSALVNM